MSKGIIGLLARGKKSRLGPGYGLCRALLRNRRGCRVNVHFSQLTVTLWRSRVRAARARARVFSSLRHSLAHHVLP